MRSSIQQPLVVLASTSKPRCTALQRLQLPFLKASPDVDETPKPNESPIAMVQRLAQAKAHSVSKQYPQALIIGGDQIGEINGTILGKPKNHDDAIEQLSHSSGNTVHFHHGLCLLNAATQEVQLAVETTRVYFRELTRELIEAYLTRDKPYQCAGSLMAESLGVLLVKRIETQDPHSLFGLPLIQLIMMLEQAGVNILRQQ